MKLPTQDELSELEELAKPLAAYLRKHYDPYCSIVIEFDSASVVRRECYTPRWGYPED